MKGPLDLARALATKADHDLKMAEIGVEHEAPRDTVAFHLQQTIEKLLKAFLHSRSIDPPRTHDIIALLDIATRHDASLEAFREPLLAMASYAVDMRYDADLDPSPDEIVAGLNAARTFREKILSLLSAHP